MFETLAAFKSKDALLKCHSKFSPALAQRLSVLILLLAGGADHHLVRYAGASLWRAE
jgi:hypothetical protein